MSVEEKLHALAPDPERLARHTGQLRPRVVRADLPPERSHRRPWTLVALTAALVAVLAVGSVAVLRHRPDQGQRGTATSAPRSTYQQLGAFSVAHTLYLANHRVRFGEQIKSIYYTAAGVLVRHGTRRVLDDAGPSRYTLVTPAGRRSDVRLPDLGDRVPGTSPSSPFLAYAAPDGKDRWRLAVVDVRTGQERGSTSVGGVFTWGGWVAPPVSTEGNRVWALFDQGWAEWDVATGQTRWVPRAAQTATPLEAAGGRYLEETKTAVSIRDFVSGRVVGATPAPSPAQETTLGSLSPDGRSFRYGETYAEYDEKGHLVAPHRRGRLLDLDTGRHTRLPSVGIGWGWTPDGRALTVDPSKDRVTVCAPTTGRCTTRHERIGNGLVRLGGASYES